MSPALAALTLLAAAAAPPAADAPERHLPVAVLNDGPVAPRFCDLQISPDGRLVAAASSDGVVRVWDRATARLLRRIDRRPLLSGFCFFTPDSRALAVAANWDGPPPRPADPAAELAWWDVATGRCLRRLTADDPWPGPFVVSPDGRFVAMGGRTKADRSVHFLDPRTGAPLGRVAMPDGYDGGDFLPDGSRFVAFGGRGAVYGCDPRTGERELWHRRPFDSPFLSAVVAAPDGRHAALNIGGVAVLDLRTGAVLWERDYPPPTGATCVAFGRGRWLVVAGAQRIVVYDPATGRRLFAQRRVPSDRRPYLMAASRDGRWLATAGDREEAVYVYDLAAW